jgi:hypothetical protein
MQFTRSNKGRFSRACLKRGGPDGIGADNSASPGDWRLGPPVECGGCVRAQRAPNGVAVQAAVFPDVRQASTCCECWRSGSHQWWVKNCDPTRVAAEQTSNTARGTPDIPAESRHTTLPSWHREVPRHAGPMGSGVPRAPFYPGLRRNRLRRTRRRKEYGWRSYGFAGCLKIWRCSLPFVPAKAGTQERQSKCLWVPAFAGTNGWSCDYFARFRRCWPRPICFASAERACA